MPGLRGMIWKNDILSVRYHVCTWRASCPIKEIVHLVDGITLVFEGNGLLIDCESCTVQADEDGKSKHVVDLIKQFEPNFQQV